MFPVKRRQAVVGGLSVARGVNLRMVAQVDDGDIAEYREVSEEVLAVSKASIIIQNWIRLSLRIPLLLQPLCGACQVDL